MAANSHQHASPWTVDFDMTIDAAPLGFRTAFKRGARDAENHIRLVNAGERGMHQKDKYPSNPYNKEGDYERWKAYNRGWNSNGF